MINRRTFLEISAKSVAVIAVVTATPNTAFSFINDVMKGWGEQKLSKENWVTYYVADWSDSNVPYKYMLECVSSAFRIIMEQEEMIAIKDITHVSYHKNHPNPGHKFAPPHRPSQKYFHVWEAQILCQIKT